MEWNGNDIARISVALTAMATAAVYTHVLFSSLTIPGTLSVRGSAVPGLLFSFASSTLPTL